MNDVSVKICVVQCFIHHATNKQVNILPPVKFRQARLLDKAYKEAIKHIWNV